MNKCDNLNEFRQLSLELRILRERLPNRELALLLATLPLLRQGAHMCKLLLLELIAQTIT